MSASPLTGKSILVTGVTGMVAGPVAAKLAAQGNTVYGAARFKDPAQRETHEAAGVQTIRVDLETRDFGEVPDGLDYVLNFAVARTNDFATDMAANGEGSAALMERCQDVVAGNPRRDAHGNRPRRALVSLTPAASFMASISLAY